MDNIHQRNMVQIQQLTFDGEKRNRSNSIYMKMRKELVARKKKKERCGWIAVIGLSMGILPFGALFVMTDIHLYQLEYLLTLPGIWIGLLLTATSYCYYSVCYKKAEEKYDSLKDELRMRIWNDYFFNDAEKEKFMDDLKRQEKITLYWK